jgi:hypothetical protein
VIDPEYLSNMERPRTSLSAKAGLIYGYGSGIGSGSLAGFSVLGHDGGIEGFLSSYGYSAARDAGWVVLVNATYAPAAVERLSELAISYLKNDVEPPAKPEFTVSPAILQGDTGYYHPEPSRHEILSGAEWLLGGSTLSVEGNALVVDPVFGRGQRLIPVSNTLFRQERDVTPSRVFTVDEDGRRLFLGDGYYGVRVPRWRVELVRAPTLAALLLIATIPVAVLAWLLGPAIASRLRRQPRPADSSFAPLKITLALLPIACLCLFSLALAPASQWGEPNLWTRTTFLASWGVPLLSLIALALVAGAAIRSAGRWFLAYAAAVTLSGLWLSAYMGASGWVGLRLWAY